VLLFLGASLLAGSGITMVDYHRPDRLAQLQVLPGAVAVPAAQEVLAAPAAPLRLNSATQTQLIALPGIGPKTAARILSYCEEHGPFSTLADLEQVPGIGPRILEQLRPLVVVE